MLYVKKLIYQPFKIIFKKGVWKLLVIQHMALDTILSVLLSA